LKKKQINKNTNLQELSENYPGITDYLQYEYGLHCLNCIMAGFETLEQGARVHGIIDKDLDEMIEEINDKVKDSNK
jgi:hybrid cluster-associated redox disulfide protein